MNSRICVTTYFLHMQQPPQRAPLPQPEHAEVYRATLSASDYLALYESIGVPWLWYERSSLDKFELQSLIGNPRVQIHILRAQGKTAGFCELRDNGNGSMQIVYFGLKLECIGLGLGAFFLDWSVRHAFASGIATLRVHTCSLDHPRALATYLSAGFVETKRETGFVTIPDEAMARQKQHLQDHAKSQNKQ